jgi:hypothetical protein
MKQLLLHYSSCALQNVWGHELPLIAGYRHNLQKYGHDHSTSSYSAPAAGVECLVDSSSHMKLAREK